jgi:catalase-peroxidase
VRGVEQAAKNAGHDVTVPFTPGRTDASQEQTDVEVIRRARTESDGFRNYLKTKYAVSARGAAGRSGATADADRA